MARLVISPNERLLLHLAEFDRFRDDPEVPLGASQEGIAQRLQIQVHAASRALAALEAEGLSFDRLAHVRGAPKRRRAYFLTDKGRHAANAIRMDISKRPVTLEIDGKVTQQPLEEAIRKIASATGTTPSLADVVDLARSSDLISSSSFQRPSTPRAPPELVMRSQGRPRVESFFGREVEKRSLADAIEGREASTILVCGMPGIGKSALASRAFEEFFGRRSMMWYSLREWDTDSSLLSALVEFLEANGMNSTSIASRRHVPVSGLFTPLVNDLSEGDYLLFLDDVQKPSEKSLSILLMIVEAVRASRRSKIILVSRSVPKFYSKAEPGTISIELTPLDRDSSWKMAQSLNAKDTIRVVDESHGHPLLIRLMSRGTTGPAKGDVIAYIEQEVYSSVSSHERQLLQLLSIFRHPVPVEALDETDYPVLAGLKQRALIFEHESGVWTHDLLREFFESRTDRETRLSLHRKSASYCETRSGVEWKLETLFHFVEGEDWDNATRMSLAGAIDLANEFPVESLALISRIPADTRAPKEQAELLFLRGQLRERVGKPELALTDFEQSLGLLGEHADADKRATVLEAVARLQSQVQRWSESLTAHEKALRLYEQTRDAEGQIRERLNMGGVLRRRGDFGKARDAYQLALALATKGENRPSQAACLNNIGMLDWDEGRLREAEVKLRESVSLAHAVRDHMGEAQGLENLAEILRSESRYSEMTNLLRESSEAFRRAGDLAEFKRMQSACASALGEQGKYVEGIELCQMVLSHQEFRKRRGLFERQPVYDPGDAAVSAALVDLLRSSGDLKRATKEIERYNRISGSLGDKSLLARGMMMRSMISEAGSDLDAAVAVLGEAENLLRSEGNCEGLTAVHMRIGMIEEKRGNEDEAAVHYQEAARQASLVGNEYARALALENLSMVRGP